MGILDDLGDFFTKRDDEKKEAPVVMYQNIGAVERSDYTYKSLAKEGYKENAIVYRCVNEIANGAASVKFKVFQGDIQLQQHPLISILERPSPQLAGNEYFQGLYSFLLLSGNSYAVRSDINGSPSELHLLRPDRVTITPSKTTIPESYNYKIGGSTVSTYPVDPETGQSEVKHFKLWNPLDDYYGLSPINAAALDIDQHNLAARHNVNLLNNGARPSGAIIFKPMDESGMTVQLSDVQRQQLQSDLLSRFGGTQNAGRPMLLEGDFDWKEMGLSPKDMDFLQLKNMSARDIALCFGVPAQLVGVPDSQTYNNIAEARLALYEETIIPLMKRVESDMNEWLSPIYGDDIRMEYDIDSIPAMAERRRLIYQNAIEAVREGIISRNEARDRLGLEKITGGDDVYINANLFPLGSPMVAEQEGDPDAQVEDDAKFLEKYANSADTFDNIPDAEARASEIGCSGTHTHDVGGATVVMPCASHDEYERLTNEEMGDGKYTNVGDRFGNRADARARARQIGCSGTHTMEIDGVTVYMPCSTHAEYTRRTKDDPRMGEGGDLFNTVAEADSRATELGCTGHHTLKTPDGNVYMPCESHAQYLRVTGKDLEIDDDAKAESDVDLKPTRAMANNAAEGLELRRQFNRGGTEVGVARAVQLKNRENLSPSTVRRMHSFFSRHEVDNEAVGFRRGEEGFPSAGFIAWQLWGGDEGQTWAKAKRDELNKEAEERKAAEMMMFPCCEDCGKDFPRPQEGKQEVTGKIKTALEGKVKEHNDKHGDKKGKRVTLRMLSAVFRRGVGAYRTNPESVRRNVMGPDQWGLARVNAFLVAVRTGRYRSGQFDRDLLPNGHPLKT